LGPLHPKNFLNEFFFNPQGHLLKFISFPGSYYLRDIPAGYTRLGYFQRLPAAWHSCKRKAGRPFIFLRQPGYLLLKKEIRGFPSPAHAGFGFFCRINDYEKSVS
jgi:hypothetical protein